MRFTKNSTRILIIIVIILAIIFLTALLYLIFRKKSGHSHVPTTQSPTTQLPTTRSPITQLPTTRSPITQLPTTQSPTTQSPTTQSPTEQKLQELFKKAEDKFNDTTSSKEFPNGGLFAQTLGLRDLQPIIEAKGETQLYLMASCSPNMEFKSCSPWLYLRRDMNPMAFLFPGLGLDAPMVGILLDNEKIFPMIGTTGLVDADSNNGSCCCNAAGYFVLQYYDGQTTTGLQNGNIPNNVKTALGKKYDKNATYYIAGDYNMINGTPAWIPGTAPTVCEQCKNTSIPSSGSNYLCQVNQAGAGVNTWDTLLIYGDQKAVSDCYDVSAQPIFATQNDKDVYNKDPKNMTKYPNAKIDLGLAQNLKATQYANKPISGPMFEIKYKKGAESCALCNKPTLCVFKNPADGRKSEININYQTPDGPIVGSLIGNTGMGYFDEFTPSLVDPNATNTQGIKGRWLNTPSLAVRQCKFQRNDFNAWINIQKQFYKSFIDMVDPKSPTFFKDVSDGVHPFQQMYNANPSAGQYFEHEVNMYIDPDHNSKYYKEQQQRFLDSIIGFFYYDQSCEETMDEIKNVSTPKKISDGTDGLQSNLDRKDWNKYGSYDTPEARCDGYFMSAPNPGSRITGNDRRQAELQKKQQMRIQVLEIVRLFNEKYNRTVLPLQSYIHSNAFIGYNQTKLSLEGKLKFSDIFQLIEPNETDNKILSCWRSKMEQSNNSKQTLLDAVNKNLDSLTECVASITQGPNIKISKITASQYKSQYRNYLKTKN